MIFMMAEMEYVHSCVADPIRQRGIRSVVVSTSAIRLLVPLVKVMPLLVLTHCHYWPTEYEAPLNCGDVYGGSWDFYNWLNVFGQLGVFVSTHFGVVASRWRGLGSSAEPNVFQSSPTW